VANGAATACSIETTVRPSSGRIVASLDTRGFGERFPPDSLVIWPPGHRDLASAHIAARARLAGSRRHHIVYGPLSTDNVSFPTDYREVLTVGSVGASLPERALGHRYSSKTEVELSGGVAGANSSIEREAAN
jgi:hypothetical protein